MLGTPPEGDRRRQIRVKKYLDALVVAEKGLLMVDCKILDMSLEGAKVKANWSLPDQFFLIELRSGKTFDVHVVWRDQPFFGLRFHQSLMVTDTWIPPFVHQAYFERKRAGVVRKRPR